MLSPGEFHQRVPRDPLANLKFRRMILGKAKKDKQLRQQLWNACAVDCLFYLNVFGFLYEPRTRKVFPFATWPVQDRAMMEIIQAIDDQVDLHVDKSRDMGASWLCLYAMDWMYRFHERCKFLMVSRNEALVDKSDDADSLFWKLDFLQARLPGFLKPKEQNRIKLNYTNYDRNNSITGAATTGAAGVGGRATALFCDELSRWDPKECADFLDGTADTADCRIFNFTPMDEAHPSYTRVAARKDIRRVEMNWWEDPRKNKGLYKYDRDKRTRVYLDKLVTFPADYPFVDDGKLRSIPYDREEKRRGPRVMARMWGRDFQASAFQFFDGGLIEDCQRTFAQDPWFTGELVVNDAGEPVNFNLMPGGAWHLWMNLDAAGNPPLSLYGVAADISMGTGRTNSVASVWDCKTGHKVLEWATPDLNPEAFARRVVGLCRWLRDHGEGGAKLIWELNGPGMNFAKKVIGLGYRHLYYRKQTEAGIGTKTVSSTPGWLSHPDPKRILFEEYREGLASKRCVNRSHIALAECLRIVYLPNGTIEHSGSTDLTDPTTARTNHGDRATADALGWKLVLERMPQLEALVNREPVPGTLAWRREYRKRQEEASEAWA